jgi:hypothetical protein
VRFSSIRTTGNFPRRTSVFDVHVDYHLPYVYDYITKFCRQQAETIQIHENANVCNIVQRETEKYKNSLFVVVKLTTVQVARLHKLLH